jgi:hypothetical protein
VSGSRRALSWLVGAIAVAMAVAGGYGLMALGPRALGALAALEVVLAAGLVLPWFTVNAYRAAVRFSSEQAGASAWGALAAASVLLVLGQFAAFAPAALDLRGLETALVLCGQLFPAIFRVVLCWALWRMRRAYLGTGLDFHLTKFDYVAAAAVAVMVVALVLQGDVLFGYWTANVDFDPAARSLAIGIQVANYLLYGAVFFASLSITRFAVQMGGGLVARAWGGVALYGLLQTFHVFVIALLWPRLGPAVAVAFDNFVVLAAFAALAFGPIYQLEAADVSRSYDRSRG